MYIQLPSDDIEILRKRITLLEKALASALIQVKQCTTQLKQEILERKRAEAALIESEEKFHRFIENSVDVIYSQDVKGVFTYLSPNFYNILGYKPEEYIGKNFEQLVHPDDLKSCFTFLNQISERDKKQGGLEFRVKRKDNTWCWMIANTSPIQDEEGNVIGYQGIARDVTERRQTDKTLLRISKAVESVADAIGIADTLGVPTICISTEMPTLDKAVIRIFDNGVGMSKEVQQKLFDPFYTTKPVGKGTGMGLSISYQIITNRHCGTLSCISSPGMGAKFIIEIPIQQSGNGL